MSPRSPRPLQPPHPARLRHRDHGLRRVRQITAWTAAGGLVVTGGLATLAERAFSGLRTTSAAAQAPDGTNPADPNTAPFTSPTVASTTPAVVVPSATTPPPVVVATLPPIVPPIAPPTVPLTAPPTTVAHHRHRTTTHITTPTTVITSGGS